MRRSLWVLLAVPALTFGLSAQLLIAHRPRSSGANQYLGLPKGTEGFLADDFQVGVAGEDWVIDHIRLWAVPDPKLITAHAPGELFAKITLFGGIAPEPPTPNEVHCDCHNLPALRTAFFERGGASFNTPHDSLTLARQADGADIWQIDFEDLKWSVPGAKAIQFGVIAEPRSAGKVPSLYWVASAAEGGQHLRVFTSDGKFQKPFGDKDVSRINIQVWGHLLAKVSIQRSGDELVITLRRQPSLEASQVDPASLRFGPQGVSPGNVRVVDVDHPGQPDLVMSVTKAGSGLSPKDINACLSGQRLDGAPFQGCDLVPH